VNFDVFHFFLYCYGVFNLKATQNTSDSNPGPVHIELTCKSIRYIEYLDYHCFIQFDYRTIRLNIEDPQ